jgi:predicted dehydrogenase
MDIAIVGCGFVADYYLLTLQQIPSLRVKGVFDLDTTRSGRLGARYGMQVYPSMDALLGDKDVSIVLNLTNPGSHFEVSRAALESGKHVYSEKPLAMEMGQARMLVDLAERRSLMISSAPCSLLGETAQTAWKALRENSIGTVRIAYAEMDDGPVHLMRYRDWASASGIPWPWKDEFEVGCTLEHAGYYLPWLLAFFGPALSVTSFSSTQVQDKRTDRPLEPNAPDFSVACIEHSSGVVSRLTCSIIAPHDHALRVVGDGGVLSVRDCWDYYSPVSIKRWRTIRRKTFLGPFASRVRLLKSDQPRPRTKGAQVMAFARGPLEMADAIRESRPSRLSSSLSLHMTEIALAIHSRDTQGRTQMSTTFQDITPMKWAT